MSDNTENTENPNFYEDLYDITKGGYPEDTSVLNTDQKAALCVKMRADGRSMQEVSEYFRNTGSKLSVGYGYRLVREYAKDDVSELEAKTFLDNFIDQKTVLEGRIREITRVMEGEIPKYVTTIVDGVEEKERISGNAKNYCELLRARHRYESDLREMISKSGLMPNKDQDMFSTLGSTKPEELKKEDMENMTDSELMVKLIQSLKRQGQSPSSMGKRTLANLKDEKILGN